MEWHVGQRLSFQSSRCTIRYFGKIKGKDDLWLGVEWDDPNTGKHDGSLNGHRYFTCLSGSPRAASFIRPSRKADSSVSLLQALLEKYTNPGDLDHTIQISGKTVEEVGFEKIQQQIQDFRELKTVVLDKRCISSNGPGFSLEKQVKDLENIEPKVRELDLSGNLLETWTDVLELCASLRYLRSLDVSGNRFLEEDGENVPPKEGPKHPPSIASLNIEDTILTWKQITSIVESLPNLTNLKASRNNVARVSTLFQASQLRELDLSYNRIDSLQILAPVLQLSNLSHLFLRGNSIVDFTCEPGIQFASLTHLDLADTQLNEFSALDDISKGFPSLEWLLTKGTPLSKLPSSTLLTIARIPYLASLNHVKISSEERQNAEIYYIGTIVKDLENTSDPDGEAKILRNHPRWTDLCRIYGTPQINKSQTDIIDPDTLEARVTSFTFYISTSDCQKAHQNYEKEEKARRSDQTSHTRFKTPSNETESTSNNEFAETETLPKSGKAKAIQEPKSSNPDQIMPNQDLATSLNKNEEEINSLVQDDKIIEKTTLIPRTISNYAIQGIVGRLFALPPPFTTTIRLFLEFDEWVSGEHFTSGSKGKNRQKTSGSNHATASNAGDNGQIDGGSDDDDSGWSLSQDDDDVYNDVHAWLRRKKEREKHRGRMVRRSIELEPSTRGIGDFVSWKGFEVGKEAKVKVVIV